MKDKKIYRSKEVDSKVIRDTIDSRLEVDVSKVRNTDEYPLGPISGTEKQRDGEWVNEEAFKCNNFGWDGDKKNPSDPTWAGAVHKQMIALQFSVSPTLDDALLALEKNKLSVHFIVDKEGAVTQLVDIYYRAYALGVGNLAEDSFLHPKVANSAVKDNLNSFAISIMNINNGKDPFTPAQIQSTAILMDDLCKADSNLDPKKVIGHYDWTPARQVSPGPYFPMDTLAQAAELYKGIGVERNFGLFPKMEDNGDTNILLSWNHLKQQNETINLPENIDKYGSMLRKYGYDIPQEDITSGIMTDSLGKALLSFRLHFNGAKITQDQTQLALWNESVQGPDRANASKELATFTKGDAAILEELNKLVVAEFSTEPSEMMGGTEAD